MTHELDHEIANVGYVDPSTGEVVEFHCNESLEGRTDIEDPSSKACAGYEALVLSSLLETRPHLGLGCLLNGFDAHNHLYAGRRDDLF